MTRIWLRIAVAVASILPNAVRAQSSWAGGYAGLDVTAQFGSAFNVTGSVAPYQYPGFAAPYQLNVGASIDYRIPPHWVLHAEYAFSAYAPMTITDGAATQIRFQPMLHAVRGGIAYQF